jgi:hypothetical protein
VAASQGELFTSFRKLAHPVKTQRDPYENTSLFQQLAFFCLDLPAKFRFAGTMHSVAASQDALFTSFRKLTHPVETPKGSFGDPSLLQHLAFFYLYLHAKFCFAGILHSVAASQDALFTSSRNLAHPVETRGAHLKTFYLHQLAFYNLDLVSFILHFALNGCITKCTFHIL